VPLDLSDRISWRETLEKLAAQFAPLCSSRFSSEALQRNCVVDLVEQTRNHLRQACGPTGYVESDGAGGLEAAHLCLGQSSPPSRLTTTSPPTSLPDEQLSQASVARSRELRHLDRMAYRMPLPLVTFVKAEGLGNVLGRWLSLAAIGRALGAPVLLTKPKEQIWFHGGVFFLSLFFLSSSSSFEVYVLKTTNLGNCLDRKILR